MTTNVVLGWIAAGAMAVLPGNLSMASVETELPLSQVVREAQLTEGRVAFTVSAGRLPIRDMDSDQVRGRMFYTAFTRSSPSGNKRPVLFVWGGGPSGPSIDMQMHYGPKRIGPEGKLVDNPNSLLAVADLVFVDPIGTGFSRPVSPEHGQEFYGTTGDARSVAEFVRVWTALNDRENAPLFLTGQSYGVWRAAIVAELLEQSGRRVAGAILTSGGMGLADEFITRTDDVAMRVPDYAATALHHGRLTGDRAAVMAEAKRWAAQVYAPALNRIDALSAAERETIATQLANRTGYPMAKIDRATLSFTPRQYLSDFPGAAGQRLNTFDMRLIDGTGRSSSDPAAQGRRARSQSRYLREFVGYRTDLAYLDAEPGYAPVNGPAYRPPGSRWQWDSAAKGQEAKEMERAAAGEGPPGKQPWMLRALRINPTLRVFVEIGHFDSLNYCAAGQLRVANMPADVADNFVLRCYFAGHGTFRDADTNPEVMEDMRAFIAETIARP